MGLTPNALECVNHVARSSGKLEIHYVVVGLVTVNMVDSPAVDAAIIESISNQSVN